MRSEGGAATGATRRRFVLAVGAVTTAGVFGGCRGVTDYEFRADPVVLSVDRRTELGYAEQRRSSVVTESTRSMGGADVHATVESQVSVYTGSDGVVPPAPLVVVSTPAARVRDESLNPLARRSTGALLTSGAGARFRERLALAPGDETEWTRPPTVVTTRETRCVGTQTTVESHAGLLVADARPAAVVHLSRVEADSVVFVGAAHRHAVPDADDPLVGPDAPVAEETVAAAAETVAEAVGALEYAAE